MAWYRYDTKRFALDLMMLVMLSGLKLPFSQCLAHGTFTFTTVEGNSVSRKVTSSRVSR